MTKTDGMPNKLSKYPALKIRVHLDYCDAVPQHKRVSAKCPSLFAENNCR